MHIAFVVNDIRNERVGFTTTHLAMHAVNQGHDVYYMDVGAFSIHPDNHIYAYGVSVARDHHRSAKVFLQALQNSSITRRIAVDKLDVLMLRNDPVTDAVARPWARRAAINFGRFAMEHGVLVLNDPDGLDRAFTKLYLKSLPLWTYPRTLITRDKEEIRSFISDEGGYAILKPLFGSGGKGVFVVRPHDEPNLNQMIESNTRDGYVIAQQFLPGGVEGDTRLIVMDNEPLRCNGKIAAIHRQRREGDQDIRSNMTAGAIAVKADVTDKMLELVKAIKPFLSENGIFLAGLDIVDNQLMEVNVLSPGGLVGACELEGENFFLEIIKAIEDKLEDR